MCNLKYYMHNQFTSVIPVNLIILFIQFCIDEEHYRFNFVFKDIEEIILLNYQLEIHALSSPQL